MKRKQKEKGQRAVQDQVSVPVSLDVVDMLQNEYISGNQYPGKWKNGGEKEEIFHHQNVKQVSRGYCADNLDGEGQYA